MGRLLGDPLSIFLAKASNYLNGNRFRQAAAGRKLPDDDESLQHSSDRQC